MKPNFIVSQVYMFLKREQAIYKHAKAIDEERTANSKQKDGYETNGDFA